MRLTSTLPGSMMCDNCGEMEYLVDYKNTYDYEESINLMDVTAQTFGFCAAYFCPACEYKDTYNMRIVKRPYKLPEIIGIERLKHEFTIAVESIRLKQQLGDIESEQYTSVW
jgi:hypothetical protein